MVLFEASYLHLAYYAAHDVLISQWYGRCTSSEYRDALERFMHYVVSMNIQYAISDRRLLPPLSDEDAQWTTEVFLEGFRKLPLKRFAIIKSFSSSAGKQLHNSICNKYRPLSFEAKSFNDLTSAYDWLTTPEHV
ncbi:hypothetical protein [Pontibacter rugosus]|uniref:STAS/SEC14 domain-containing protein n=1 Tax=Pontibacter rugosus TaxID=1745966 RepID=A0ABW3SQB8_9BACT